VATGWQGGSRAASGVLILPAWHPPTQGPGTHIPRGLGSCSPPIRHPCTQGSGVQITPHPAPTHPGVWGRDHPNLALTYPGVWGPVHPAPGTHLSRGLGSRSPQSGNHIPRGLGSCSPPIQHLCTQGFGVQITPSLAPMHPRVWGPA